MNNGFQSLSCHCLILNLTHTFIIIIAIMHSDKDIFNLLINFIESVNFFFYTHTKLLQVKIYEVKKLKQVNKKLD